MTIYPDDEDGRVLASLAAHGIDMTQALVIEFQVAAPNDASAVAIGNALTNAGYENEIVFDEGEPDENGDIDPEEEDFGPSWTVYAIVQMVPEYDEIMRIQSDLDRLASPHDGFSDGWGVMLDNDSE